MKSHDQQSAEIMIHHGNISCQKDVSAPNLITVIISEVKTLNYWTNINFNGIPWQKKKEKRQKQEHGSS